MAKPIFGKWIDTWLKSMEPGMSAMDAGTWMPFNQMQFFPYYSDLWVGKLLEAKRSAEKNGITIKELADSLNGTLLIRTEMQFLLYDLKATGLNGRKEGSEALDFFNDLLKAKCLRDPYGFKSSIIHTGGELNSIEKKARWKKADLNSAKDIGRLINSCSELSWALFSDFHYTNWYENFGPYKREDGTFILRKYMSFRPAAIWSEMRNFRFKDVQIYTKYRGIKVRFDCFNHIYCNGNMPQCMTKFAVAVDGNFLESIHEIREVAEYLGERAAEQYTLFSDLGFEETKKKMVWVRHYGFMDLFSKAGIDWKPDEKIMERIEGKELLPAKLPKFKTEKQAKKWWRSFFDPRNDFFPREWKTKNVLKG